jgi:membrane protease YdiL (CAAX protease family)
MIITQKRQIFELIFVPAFAFLPSLILSIGLLIKGTEHINYSDASSSIFFTLIYECAALSLLYYVLYKRNENFTDLGLSFTWGQLQTGIILAVAVLIVTYIVEWILIKSLPPAFWKYLHPKNTDFIPLNFSLLFSAFLLINAFTEEAIVRAFIIRETISLTNNKTAAIFISVLFQASYHLYQGILPALIVPLVFLMYSIYYVKTGKLTPVIVAHIIMDIIAVLSMKHK